MDSFDKKLRLFHPHINWITDRQECLDYGTDWTRQNSNASGIVFPKSTEEVQQILKLAQEERVSVVPSGGRTGLAGGAVALRGEIILSLAKMNRIFEVDILGKTLRVQAGAVTQQVHEAAEKEGLTWPIDLAAKGTSQIGGNLSTNAGGVRVIRYGMARRWVNALQVVLMGGEKIELNGNLEKNNSGYDLLQLVLGSEGTLAVITEATLKLVDVPKEREVMLFSLKSWEGIAQLLLESRRGPFEIQAFEFFTEKCLFNVIDKLKKRPPFSKTDELYVLIEVELPTKDRSELDHWLEGILEKGWVQEGVLAQSSSEKVYLWSLREGITESISHLGKVRKYDVAVPVLAMATFMKEAREAFGKLNLSIDLFNFGHFGDGSPHFNLVKQENISEEEFCLQCMAFEKMFFPLLLKFGGSASAEHGIGNQKTDWLLFSRTNVEMNIFRGIKKIFDPFGLLNPGKIFE